MNKNKSFTQYIPDTFSISVLLTLFVFVICLIFKNQSFVQLSTIFGNSFWNLNSFAMQMVLILVLGNTLAKTKFVSFIIDLIVSKVTTNKSALVVTLLVSSLACWVNWGFGLIVGALISIEMARKIKNINFPLLVTAAYAGFMVWHGGISGSIPLDLNTRTGIFNRLTYEFVSSSDSIFTWFNFTLIACTVLTSLLVILFYAKESNPVVLKEEIKAPDQEYSALEKNIILPKIIAILGFIYLVCYLSMPATKMGLGLVCSIFLFSSLILHNNFKSFLNAFNGSIKNASGIIIQFPFYAAIMGMISSTGLARDISAFFVSISTKDTILILTYLSSGLINFFVPSGGGQWAIQAPIIIPAAKQMGIPISKMAMSVAWGDAWTNIIQPFWAIPILGMAGLGVKDIFKYCFTLFWAVGIVCSIAFYFMS
jgi:short-chain fatty acids transporter